MRSPLCHWINKQLFQGFEFALWRVSRMFFFPLWLQSLLWSFTSWKNVSRSQNWNWTHSVQAFFLETKLKQLPPWYYRNIPRLFFLALWKTHLHISKRFELYFIFCCIKLTKTFTAPSDSQSMWKMLGKRVYCGFVLLQPSPTLFFFFFHLTHLTLMFVIIIRILMCIA